MPVCCVAGTRLNSGLAGVGVIFVLAMVAMYEYSSTFVPRGKYVRSVDGFQIEKVFSRVVVSETAVPHACTVLVQHSNTSTESPPGLQ